MFGILPLLAGTGSSALYTWVLTCITTFRLCLLIKIRKYYSKWDFFFELVDKIIWVLFNAVHIAYWSLDLQQIDQSIPQYKGLLSWIGKIEIVVFLLGCIIELILALI